jgi:hypothetical protein
LIWEIVEAGNPQRLLMFKDNGLLRFAPLISQMHQRLLAAISTEVRDAV